MIPFLASIHGHGTSVSSIPLAAGIGTLAWNLSQDDSSEASVSWKTSPGFSTRRCCVHQGREACCDIASSASVAAAAAGHGGAGGDDGDEDVAAVSGDGFALEAMHESQIYSRDFFGSDACDEWLVHLLALLALLTLAALWLLSFSLLFSQHRASPRNVIPFCPGRWVRRRATRSVR